MSGALSKRQQARNERTLQDLIKTVPGNNICADCQARNPGWASWNLGVFLCMRCAAVHRKLGTHITKVKSLSMDSWSNEQVENMKRVGNTASNRTHNPQNAKPPIPIDADEADSAMERFIRQKYQERAVTAAARNNTGSTNSDDQPPPLPPKTGSRFGFRSASSIFPLSSKSKREAEISRQQSPSPPRSKPSRIFGTSMASDEKDDLAKKMGKLRDMGFMDERRNLAVLKGLSGNLEKSIETLVRLGEGGGGPRRPAQELAAPVRSRTPMSAGITIDRSREVSSPKGSNNPWEVRDRPPPVAQPQSSQSTGALAQSQQQMMGNNPYQQSQTTNPFGLAPSQSQYNLNQAFQNMSVSPAQPPLFPHHTGGFPGPQPTQHQQMYQQSMTPPVPSLPQQYYPSVIYENSAQQPQQQNSYNPFMQQQPPSLNTNISSNPYSQQLATPQSVYHSPLEQSPHPQYPSSPSFYQNGAQQQTQLQSPEQQMNPYLNQASYQQQINPFYQNGQQPEQVPQQNLDFQAQPQSQYQIQYGLQYQENRQQSLPLMAQATGKADKRSILDLYNYPQSAPAPIQQPQQDQLQSQVQNPPAAGSQAFAPQQQGRVSSPLAAPTGSNNPFAPSGGTEDTLSQIPNFASSPNGTRKISRESMAIDTGGWANGRHSPDAWGSISARSMR